MDNNMEQQDSSQPPDLATVLRNLAALAPPPAPTPQASSAELNPPGSGTDPQVAPISHQQYHADPRLAGRSRNQGLREQPRVPAMPTSTTPTPIAQASAPAPIDPATIIEWAPGLRCITKVSARNPNLKFIVQKMIAEQHGHELTWRGGRQALMQQRASKEQLKAYDQKVYKAQVAMFNAQSGQLKSLCVPFFGVKPELIVKDDQAITSGGVATSGRKTKVTERELMLLQRRMIEYLEDMYKD